MINDPAVEGRILAHSLTVAGVDAGYGAVRVLHDISLRVADGETVVLLGANGNGKSTLLCIAGIVTRAAAASLETAGRTQDLVGLSPEAIVDLGIALVPRAPSVPGALGRGEPGARRVQAGGGAQLAANLAFVYEVFPVLRERRASWRHERRRAADGGARARPDVGTLFARDRRASVTTSPRSWSAG